MPTKSNDELKPCPFDCGGEVSDLEIYKEHIDSICVRCGYCGAQGEQMGTTEGAKVAWNRRVKLTEVVEKGGTK